MARNYSNTAADTTLTAGIAAGDLSMVVASATGWPAATFAAVIDPGLVTEEVVQVTAKVGTTFTITRGFDGTTAAAHALGATVRHAAIAGDFTDLQTAITTEATARGNADTTLSSTISTHTALTTAAHGGIVASTDPRLTDSRTPTAHASTHASAGSDPIMIAESQVTNLTADLALKAPLASPTFTGVPAGPTAALATNTTQLATTAFVLANAGGGSADKLGLTPTAVKTANYSASAGDFVPCDTSGGTFAVTFPTAPADGSVLAIKLITAGNTLTLTLGGADVFNKAGGAATGSLTLLNQTILCQYKATGAIWYVVAADLSLSTLDARYQPLDSDLTAIAALATTAYGRSFLALADATAARVLTGAQAPATTLAGYGITDAQPLDSDLTAIAALATTAFGRSYLVLADATAGRTLAGSAPLSATYITQTANSELSAEQALSALSTGILKSTTTTGVLSIAAAADLPLIPEARVIVSGVTQYSIPGIDLVSVSTKAMTASRIYYTPIYVATAISIDQMVVEVSTAGAAATVARLALYNADTSWQPTTRVVDAGTVATDSTGVKTATVAITLPPGRYLSATISDGTPTLRAYRGGGRYFGLVVGLSGNPFIFQAFVAGAGSTLPDPGTVYTTASGGATSVDQLIVYRISTP